MRFFSLCLVLFLVPVGRADEVSFRRDLAPVLVQKCLACHGPKKAKGSYRVDTFEKLALPGDTGEPDDHRRQAGHERTVLSVEHGRRR